MESSGIIISEESQRRDGLSSSIGDVAESSSCDLLNFEIKLYPQGTNTKEYAVNFAKNIIGCLHPSTNKHNPWKKRIDDIANLNPLKFVTYNPLFLALGLSFHIYVKKHNTLTEADKFNSWKAFYERKMTLKGDKSNGFEKIKSHIDNKDLIRYILLWREMPVAAPLSCY
jgi:hypothetical protein